MPFAFNPFIQLFKSSNVIGKGCAIATANFVFLAIISSSLSLVLIFLADGFLSMKILLNALGS